MPKQILIKTLYPAIYDRLCQELSCYPKIKFFYHKNNGEYTIVIKCANYYQKVFPTVHTYSIYQSYLYLYTALSLILCNIMIDFFEDSNMKCIFASQVKNLSVKQKSKIKALSSFLLDVHFPSENAKKIYLYRKDLIFQDLLFLFRKQNHITIEAVALFGLSKYHIFLKELVKTTQDLILQKKNQKDFINFILNNFFK